MEIVVLIVVEVVVDVVVVVVVVVAADTPASLDFLLTTKTLMSKNLLISCTHQVAFA